jgi:hypothetical protein
MRTKARRIVNIRIAVMVAGAWLGMIFLGGGDLAQRGIGSMKYFTVLSNLLCGIAAVIWLVYERKGGSEAVERLKYIAAASVGLTFTVVMAFLGPLYGYPEMFAGANLWLHLIVPVAAMAEIVFLSDAVYTKRDNNIAIIPPLIYGIVYLVNILLNGMGEWPNTNDWYLFFYWGYPVGVVIYLIIMLVTWLLGFFMRKAQAKVKSSRVS